VRLELLDEERLKLLAEAGCTTLHFGIESGSERIRKQVLKRNISNEVIIDKARLVKKYRLKFNTYNMLDIPTETIADGLETVKINTRIKTDYPWCSLLQPYPGTQIWEDLVEKGKDLSNVYNSSSFYESSPVEQQDSGKLNNLQKLFFLGVKAPWMLPLIKRLICLPPNFIFNLVFLITFGYRHMRSNQLGPYEALRFNLRHIGIYFKQ
jgi:radical SAM superfamily enzyme YgiQ (UPF0313 family)